jgi:Holliday junction resolvasome RuvABC ATP-dependent DNA helicase subunit
MLTAPLRERFGIVHHLDYYADAELERIIVRSAGVLGVPIDGDATRMIAARSRGTPRVANRLLRRVRDFAEVRANGRITAKVADDALSREGVDEVGLDRLDRAFLQTLVKQYRGGKRSRTLSSRICSKPVSSLERQADGVRRLRPTTTSGSPAPRSHKSGCSNS